MVSVLVNLSFVRTESEEASALLLARLTEFTNLILRGVLPDFIIATFF